MTNSKPEAGSAVVEGGETSVAPLAPADDEGIAGRKRKGEDVIRGLRTENRVLLDHNDRMSKRIVELEFEVERLGRQDKSSQAAIYNLTKACEEEREACAAIAWAEAEDLTNGELHRRTAIKIHDMIRAREK